MQQQKEKLVAIIEDNSELSDMLTEIIEDEGYQTVQYTSPQFIQHFESMSKKPDLFLIDAWLNGYTSGITQTKALLEQEDPPAIILMSSDESVQYQTENVDIIAFIQKPFHIEELLTIINQTLDPKIATPQ